MAPRSDNEPHAVVKSILFVCTGNIFRSMSAEYALKAHLGTAPAYHVHSAGTSAGAHPMIACVCDRLARYGVDPSPHVPRRLTAEMLDEAYLPVAMGLDHQAAIRERFGRSVLLFNEICYGRSESVKDLWEVLPETAEDASKQAYLVSIVEYVWNAMPHFVERIEWAAVQHRQAA